MSVINLAYRTSRLAPGPEKLMGYRTGTFVGDLRIRTIEVHAADERADNDPTTTHLDELCGLAARQMLATALLAEGRAYLGVYADLLDESGHRLVVANGYANEREVMTGAGMAEVKVPRVDARNGGKRTPRFGCGSGSGTGPWPASRSGRSHHRSGVTRAPSWSCWNRLAGPEGA